MRRLVVNALAFIGGLTVLASLAGFTVRHLVSDGGATGIVLDADAKPVAGVPIFLNRGNAAIERYVTDSRGRFALPLKNYERRRATWLICAPGAIPMVGVIDGDGFQIGPATYTPGKLSGAKGAHIRTSGWLGPIPRECPPALDSVGWRIPSNLDQNSYQVSFVEPEWNGVVK